ncbi:hypothetical protein BDP27DRAFT_1431029 [Rhodocollybia butyracea]|uniref:CxC2-like cysteine cluster KDZ transposase-associated domain-containing protein n=1 Tax=Rhodocollybia butyracea TaxID=206335 RepID=A0A9P5TZP1_9AGAR|nr:hypothetical protein BDP27DRAFT_1431029 [Rhodocollybia butyracea]
MSKAQLKRKQREHADDISARAVVERRKPKRTTLPMLGDEASWPSIRRSVTSEDAQVYPPNVPSVDGESEYTETLKQTQAKRWLNFFFLCPDSSILYYPAKQDQRLPFRANVAPVYLVTSNVTTAINTRAAANCAFFGNIPTTPCTGPRSGKQMDTTERRISLLSNRTLTPFMFAWKALAAVEIRVMDVRGDPDMVEQLMKARLFPASAKDPRTLITFQALDDYTEHHLASKKSSYDYIGALHHLSDGFSTEAIPVGPLLSLFALSIQTPLKQDPREQFLFACRTWRKLQMDKHSGQAFDLGAEFPHRTPGSIIKYCVACPEDGFNMEPGWERTPDKLRHLNQEQWTLDGNFHLGQYTKNTDPNNICLVTDNGIGYFPDQVKVDKYLKNTSEDQEKSTCNYLKVINNQNKKKFKNMRYSGVKGEGPAWAFTYTF